MSMPPPVKRPSEYYFISGNPSSGVMTQTFATVADKVQSSYTPPVHTPFRYITKVWEYKGRLYSREVGWYPPKKKRTVRPSSWRDPTPYSCFKRVGDLSNFAGNVTTYAFPPDLRYFNSQTGMLPTNFYDGMAVPALPERYSSGLESRAVVKALNKLKDQKVNLAVALAERAETAELLVNTLAGLTKAANSLRRGDMRGVAKGLGLRKVPKGPRGEKFFDKWLEYQYGWDPLLQDVYGAVSALHQADQDDPKRYTVTVSARVKDSNESRRTVTSSGGWKTYSEYKTLEGAFVRLDYYLENPFLASLSALGITNPALVVWERVPSSFMIDWVIPIGNYLSAFDATLGYKFRAGSLSRLFRGEWSADLLPFQGNRPPGSVGPVWGHAQVSQMRLDRTIYGSSPLPRIPSFKNPFSKQDGRHIANAISLFASSLLGHKR